MESTSSISGKKIKFFHDLQTVKQDVIINDGLINIPDNAVASSSDSFAANALKLLV